ncbi:MAG: cytosine permease [Clostridium sp.]
MNKSPFISKDERVGTPKELFTIWFASNIGILGVVYGAIIVGYNLSFLQSLLAAAVGAASFALVGYLSLAGRDSGGTTFLLSRAAFGIKGNIIPNLLGWVNLVGWLAVNVVTGTLTLLALFAVFGIKGGTVLTVISLLVFAFLVIASSIFGQDALVKIQTFFSYVFGALTLFILILLLPKTNWSQIFAMENGSWIEGFLPAVSIIAAGTGISWSIASADYSCYQNPKSSSKSVFTAVTFGAFIPLFVIMGIGILMSNSVPELATSSNPIEVISNVLPAWVTVIYFVTALGGLIPQCIISLKSARVNLETLNIKVNDFVAVAIHAAIMILVPIYVLFVSEDFLGNFQVFLGLLGIGLASWAAVFLIDYVCIRKNVGYEERLLVDSSYNSVNKKGIISWAIGVVVGLLFTNSPFFDGIFAKGIFRDNSLGIILSFIISGLLYFVLVRTAKCNREA